VPDEQPVSTLPRDAPPLPRGDEDDYRALFEACPLPAWVVDEATSHVVAANDAAQRVCEWKAFPATPTRFDVVVDARWPAETGPAELLTSSGGRRAVQLFVRPLPFEGRAARLVYAVERADTAGAEAGAAIREAERARAEAEAANRAKDEFLAMLSHELRAPLGSILIWTQLLRTGGLDESATARALGMIERSTETLEHFIEDLLDISRIISGKLSLELRPTDVASVVQAAIEEVQPSADGKSIRISSVLDRGLPPTSGDAARLQQVVRNLLSNAVKFTPEGGSVHVELDHEDGRARIQVTDTGVGIPRHYLSSVFERFRQVDSTSSRAHRGLGLGLAIVRHLVELHGGSVTAESPGQGLGSTFTALLPLVAGARPMPSSAGTGLSTEWALDDSALAGVRVLLVDDEEDARESLRVLLERSGAEVRAVRSAAEALASLESFVPAVLLSDIAMPEEDGYRLIRKVRALDPARGGRTPAAALTAYASREDRRNALLAGYQDHVTKPPDPQKLIALLAKLARAGAAS
jgi:signal transduction histidine kinase/ActR/RegA family two-component response regulator